MVLPGQHRRWRSARRSGCEARWGPEEMRWSTSGRGTTISTATSGARPGNSSCCWRLRPRRARWRRLTYRISSITTSTTPHLM